MKRLIIIMGMLVAGIAGELRATTVCRWVPAAESGAARQRQRSRADG
ncbi:hypothetical protein [Cupriavidus sp. RAF12]